MSRVYFGKQLIWTTQQFMPVITYRHSGQDAGWWLSRARMESGLYEHTGQNARLSIHYTMDSSSYVHTGVDLATIPWFALESGEYLHTGHEMVQEANDHPAESGTYTHTGYDLEVEFGIELYVHKAQELILASRAKDGVFVNKMQEFLFLEDV